MVRGKKKPARSATYLQYRCTSAEWSGLGMSFMHRWCMYALKERMRVNNGKTVKINISVVDVAAAAALAVAAINL